MQSAAHDRSASIFLFLELWSVAEGLGGGVRAMMKISRLSDFQMLAGMSL